MTNDKRTETHACDLISRQAAIDALDKRFDSISMEQTTEILQLRRDLRHLPSAHPFATDTNVGGNLIDREMALDVLHGYFDGMLETDTVCPKDLYNEIEALPSAQPDVPDTNVGDTISRQAAIETVRKAKDKSEAHRMLIQLPSAQLDVPDTNVGDTDCISRADVIELVNNSYYNLAESIEDTWAMVADVEKLPSVTPKQPGWIPCSTALPSKYDNYLITTEDGMVVFGVYDPREKQWCRYDSIKSWWIYGIKVLAWQPIPTPYREGGQDGKN